MIFKMFKEDEVEELFNKVLIHNGDYSSATNEEEAALRAEMHHMNKVMHQKICKLGKNIN